MADLSRSIRMSVESGKVLFGSRQAVAAALNGTAKVIVISASAPKTVAADIRQYAKLSNVPIVDFPGPSKELGAVCGVPYIVSAITVMSVGNSDLLSVAKSSLQASAAVHPTSQAPPSPLQVPIAAHAAQEAIAGSAAENVPKHDSKRKQKAEKTDKKEEAKEDKNEAS